MKNRVSPRTVVYAACAIFALTTAALAQNSEPTVEVRHDSKDSKAVPITQEKESPVQFLLEAGYTSEYNFRGTNLMPDSDGGFFYQAQATIPNVGPGTLTLGVWVMNQIGDAQADSWSTSEGGGGAGITGAFEVGNGLQYARVPTTTQTSFHEIDLFVSYKFALGPIDVTLGNIGFFIVRDARTFELDIAPPGRVWVYPPTGTQFATLGPLPTVGDETFDRIYIRLSTTKLCPHLTPSITYYQTIYSDGDQPTGQITFLPSGPFVLTHDQLTGVPVLTPAPGQERNDELGGYLEAKLAGNFPVGHWLEINPYALVSYSFRDRTEPVAGTYGGVPLTGFNHAQAGLELNFHIAPHIDFSPQLAYAYHISEPPIGTDRNEFWAGIKFSVNLP